MKKVVGIVLLGWISLFADIVVTVDARKDLHLTAYRDFGVIKDTRKVALPEGTHRVRFEGVAEYIDEESIIIGCNPSENIEMVGLSYEYDLISPTKLMEKYIGNEVGITPNTGSIDDTLIKRVELLSIHEKEPVFRIGTNITYGEIGKILFPYIPENLITRPTILWHVFTHKRLDTEVEATYITEGISWKANYNLKIDPKYESGFLDGWITIKNESGTDIKSAVINFVNYEYGDFREKITKKIKSYLFSSKLRHLGKYIFYALPRRLTVLSGHSYRVEWISAIPVKLNSVYVVELPVVSTSYYYGTVFSAVEIENSEVNHLGFSLPEGILRTYKCDTSGEFRFIGENCLKDCDSGNTFLAVTGKSDSISIIRKVVKEKEKSYYGIEIKNNKKKPITLKILMETGDKNISDSSKKYNIKNDSLIEWNVVVKSNETETIKYSLKQKGE